MPSHPIAALRRRAGRLLAPAVLALSTVAPAAGEVVRVVVDRREDVLDGRTWGNAGAYEMLVGRIYFAFDPAHPANRNITDLALAPRNGEGRVEAWAEFVALQPKERGRRRGVAWVEVSNRGGKASLRYFNGASGSGPDPAEPGDFGDGLLLREGLTLVWVGWQWDVPDREGILSLHVPIVRGPDGEPMQGLVRSDWVVDEPVDVLPLSHRGHRTYAAADPADPANVLTVRDGRDAPREVVPRERWRLLAPSEGVEAGRWTMLGLEGGFEAGRIYEFVYRAQDPRMVGLGLAAMRDVASYAKFGLDSPFPVRRTVAFGVSQTGRFLRHFLYQGFNVDEGGRTAFDGMLIHTAGAGRGSFNHRFAQPSRDAHRYSAFFYPTDLFPFTSRPERDPVTGAEAGLLDATPPEHRPLVMVTNTGYEYWGRAASLIHTSPDGRRDVAPAEGERIYHLAGGQHFVGGFPPAADARLHDARAWIGDPVDFLTTLRALAVRLVAWVAAGTEPPAGAHPTLAEGTLVPPSGLALPAIPGVEKPAAAHVAYRADYGPRFATEGVIDRQPPELGPAFPSLVPQVDGLGNEASGVRGVELRVPVATYLPWSLRTGAPGGAHEMRDFVGMVAPLPADEAVRAASGDPRPSLEALYGSKGGYLLRVEAALAALVEDGLLLEEDVDRVRQRAVDLWDWASSVAPARADEPPADGPPAVPGSPREGEGDRPSTPF